MKQQWSVHHKARGRTRLRLRSIAIYTIKLIAASAERFQDTDTDASKTIYWSKFILITRSRLVGALCYIYEYVIVLDSVFGMIWMGATFSKMRFCQFIIRYQRPARGFFLPLFCMFLQLCGWKLFVVLLIFSQGSIFYLLQLRQAVKVPPQVSRFSK